MIRSLFSRRQASVLAIGLLVLAPVTARAQDDTVTFDPATITVTTADGTQSQYMVNDVSVYASTSPAYDDVPASVSMSLSLTGITPVDPALLEWITQAEGASGTLRDIAITAKSTAADGSAQDIAYMLTEAHVTSISSSFSTYAAHSISLSVEASKLTIDGVAMN